MEQGKLYLIATPIGNLNDITYRATKVLNEVDIIAAEDTRQTLKLLNHFEISKPLISYNRHSNEAKTRELISKILEGNNIGLVTDAGTPGISDPGEELVKEAINSKIDIIPIPGACAAINAIIASGLSTKQFTFYGFLPLNKKLRRAKFEDIAHQNGTIIIYEAPHRLIDTINEIENIFGNIYIVIAKEITKIHEAFFRGYITDFLNQENNIKGEYIILFEVHSKTERDEEIDELNKLNLEEQYDYYAKKGLNKKDIIKQIAKNKKVPKDEIYKKFI